MKHDNASKFFNASLATALLRALSEKGIQEYCVCPGARNAPLVALLRECSQMGNSCRVYYFFDERAAAFFALGKIRSTGRPVAVVTTSGTAAGELLPATMEGHYSSLPLVLITADRPRSFRGTGAPQTAEQVGIFGIYVAGSMDLEGEEYSAQLQAFSRREALRLPFHVNVCFDEPLLGEQMFSPHVNYIQGEVVKSWNGSQNKEPVSDQNAGAEREVELKSIARVKEFLEFLQDTRYPVVIVSLLHPEERESVVQLLLNLNVPAYFESISGLREDPRLESLRLHDSTRMMERAFQADYPIDAVLRIGGVPTLRLWRDLEDKYCHLRVLSLSGTSYPGLSRPSALITGMPLSKFCIRLCAALSKARDNTDVTGRRNSGTQVGSQLVKIDQKAQIRLQELLRSEPQSEPGMVFALSHLISADASRKGALPRVYLGNSLPIREWDLAATREFRGGDIWASRGLNGIDGQISTFLGYAKAGASNWALIGDLTALYDLQGPWILPQLLGVQVNLVIINNGGGKIFSKMFPQQEFQNNHHLRFSSLAGLWSLDYLKWDLVPVQMPVAGTPPQASSGLPAEIPVSIPDVLAKNRIIELIPSEAATHRFWESYQCL